MPVCIVLLSALLIVSSKIVLKKVLINGCKKEGGVDQRKISESDTPFKRSQWILISIRKLISLPTVRDYLEWLPANWEQKVRRLLLIWSTDIRIYSEESYKGRIRGLSYSGFLSRQCFVIQLIGAIGLSLGGLLTLILHFLFHLMMLLIALSF